MEVDACGRPSPQAEEGSKQALRQQGANGDDWRLARPPGVRSDANNPRMAEQDMEDRVLANAASAVSRDPRL
eukprot:12263019-Heterocapsa_arctica.AAC.1